MTIERLPEKKKWVMRRVPLGAVTNPAGGVDIVTVNVTKQAKVTAINVQSPGQQTFELIERNQIAPFGVVNLMPYRLQAAGIIIDARTFKDPIAWIAANKTIALITQIGASAIVSGFVKGGMDVWELIG